jgi:hypothetical protein
MTNTLKKAIKLIIMHSFNYDDEPKKMNRGSDKNCVVGFRNNLLLAN